VNYFDHPDGGGRLKFFIQPRKLSPAAAQTAVAKFSSTNIQTILHAAPAMYNVLL
jgi:hypothetical protein